MAAKDDPRFTGFLEHLEATDMLSNVFTFPELKEAADDYDNLVNATTRKAQPGLNKYKDWTLPLNEVRKLFTVYWHLNFLRTELTKLDPEVAKVWQEKQERYLKKWKNLLESRNYPEEIIESFEEHACIIKPSELESSLSKAEKPCFHGIEFTVCWHLDFLCNDLHELGEFREELRWKFKKLLYVPSTKNERQLYCEQAQSYAAYFRRVMSSHERDERGVDLSEYYNGFRKTGPEQLKMRQNALEYVHNYEFVNDLAGPLNTTNE
ncbi:hypothetical protein Q7P35_005524 [Cladosporium inversicolor]